MVGLKQDFTKKVSFKVIRNEKMNAFNKHGIEEGLATQTEHIP